jgi:hypothetical protein
MWTLPQYTSNETIILFLFRTHFCILTDGGTSPSPHVGTSHTQQQEKNENEFLLFKFVLLSLFY